tara:strand:- start:257 stop:457 length:201 start_codon:yes stop_codon:yes gene_type:complete
VTKPKPEFYTVREAQQLLDVGYSTLWRWIYAGQIKSVRRGRSVRISSTEVDRLSWATLSKRKRSTP